MLNLNGTLMQGGGYFSVGAGGFDIFQWEEGLGYF